MRLLLVVDPSELMKVLLERQVLNSFANLLTVARCCRQSHFKWSNSRFLLAYPSIELRWLPYGVSDCYY